MKPAISAKHANLVTWAVIVLAGFILAWVASTAVKTLFTLGFDQNCQAYILLAHAASASSWTKDLEYTEQAQDMATDPDLKKLATFVAMNAKAGIDSGTDSPAESNTVEGFVESAITGFTNPLLAVKVGMLLVEYYAFDYKGLAARLDKQYKAIIFRYQLGLTLGNILYWLILIGYAVLVFKKKNEMLLLVHQRVITQIWTIT